MSDAERQKRRQEKNQEKEKWSNKDLVLMSTLPENGVPESDKVYLSRHLENGHMKIQYTFLDLNGKREDVLIEEEDVFSAGFPFPLYLLERPLEANKIYIENVNGIAGNNIRYVMIDPNDPSHEISGTIVFNFAKQDGGLGAQYGKRLLDESTITLYGEGIVNQILSDLLKKDKTQSLDLIPLTEEMLIVYKDFILDELVKNRLKPKRPKEQMNPPVTVSPTSAVQIVEPIPAKVEKIQEAPAASIASNLTQSSQSTNVTQEAIPPQPVINSPTKREELIKKIQVIMGDIRSQEGDLALQSEEDKKKAKAEIHQKEGELKDKYQQLNQLTKAPEESKKSELTFSFSGLKERVKQRAHEMKVQFDNRFKSNTKPKSK